MARAKKVLIFPDVHFGMDVDNPKPRAIRELAARIVEYVQPDEVYGLGDLLDCARFSRHPPKSLQAAKAVGFVENEVEPARKWLDRLQSATSGKLYLLLGNHENSAERWCIENGLTGRDAELLMPSKLLARTSKDQPRKRVHIEPYTGPFPHLMIAPNLIATHGWSFATNALQKSLDIARSCSVVQGHVHRYMETSLRNPVTNETHYGWSPGCLCSRTPDYRAHQPTDWAFGMTQMYVSRTDPRDWSHYHLHITEQLDAMRAVMLDGKQIRVPF